MAISAKELARILNVSPATISMVFNNKTGISEATRKMVLESAKKFGYEPRRTSAQNVPVIQLVIYRKHGKIVADTPFFSEVIDGITQECRRKNCMVSITTFSEKADTRKQLAALKASGCEGMILMATEMYREDFAVFQSLKIPIVVLDCYYDDLDYDCVLINNVQGAFKATDYLIRCGHEKVGYLRSKIHISNFDERADGYFKALRMHKISTEHPYIHRISPTSIQGYQDMKEILAAGPELADAYFADNDIIAAAAMKALQEAGYRIPQDISVIGFDDMPLCDVMNPSLSTMQVRKRELGYTAVRRLLERISDNLIEKLKLSVATKLIIRDSVRTC